MHDCSRLIVAAPIYRRHSYSYIHSTITHKTGGGKACDGGEERGPGGGQLGVVSGAGQGRVDEGG